MDPNERKKKAPPLPKFPQQKARDDTVNEKVANFLQEISKQTHTLPLPNVEAPKPVTGAAVQEKKKFSMESLNSKLNSIMSNKKIDLNKMVESSKKVEHVVEQKQRRDLQIQYDPAHPNSYEQSKSHYIDIFNKMKRQKNNYFEQEDEKISKMIADFQRDGSEIEQQSLIKGNMQQQNNKLDQRQIVALRMMQKQGFKIGEGLGKQSQGIKTPLTIKKVTDSSCKIQPSNLSLANFVSIQQSAENLLQAFKIQKSKVIALRIAIQLNDLTQDVQIQIKQQCQNYGNIEECVALSTPNAILFFCKYSNVQQAFKSFTRINGRYYDEKIINVFFYPENSFNSKKFDEPLHQIIQF